MKELCDSVSAMGLAQPSGIDFGDVGDGLCGKLQDYPELQSVDEKELLRISEALSDKLKEVKAPC